MNYPMRKCRMRQLLNAVTTTDETDRIQPVSISIVKNVLKDLKQIDEESNPDEVIKQVDETFMDARIYHAATDVAYRCIQKVDYTQHSFNIEDFTEKLKNFLTNSQPDEYTLELLYSIDEHVSLDCVLPTLGNYSTLCGAKVIQVEKPKETKERAERNANHEKPTKKKLIKVTEVEQETEAKSDDILRYYMKALSDEYKSQGEPVNYFEFVIDTSDYGLTVENMFYTSFHINDGKIQLIKDDNNVAKLQPVDKKARLDVSQVSVEKKRQFTSFIDMHVWQDKCAGIREGIVQKHRRLGTFTQN